MPADSLTASSFLFFLFGIVGLLLIVVLLLFSISKSLYRIERQGGGRETQGIHKSDSPLGSPSSPTPAMMKKMTKESDFMVFLGEDSSRKTLPKREQFAAYREWRQQRGLNWPHEPVQDSPDSGSENGPT